MHTTPRKKTTMSSTQKEGRRVKRECGTCSSAQPRWSFFPFCFRGGVTGRADPTPPYEYLFFFSAGFKICTRFQLDFTYTTRQTYLERAQEGFVDTHHRACVVELSAVVWRAEQRDEMSFREELVAVLDDLGKVDSKSAIVRYVDQVVHEGVRRERGTTHEASMSPPCAKHQLISLREHGSNRCCWREYGSTNSSVARNATLLLLSPS